MVNGVRPSRAGELIKPGDLVSFRTVKSSIPEEKKVLPSRMSNSPEIIFKDADILAINKPAGLPVQGGDNRVKHLGAYFEKWSFGQKSAPRLVHRLDKDVTGALLLARTRRAAVALSKAFNPELPGPDSVEKFYLAVVRGLPGKQQGVLNRAIKYASDGTPHLASEMEAFEGNHKASQTNYFVIAKASDYSLLALQPLSGRKHQLRLHLAKELGMPIVGDPLYQTMPDLNFCEKRILLHCFCMKIKYPLFDLSSESSGSNVIGLRLSQLLPSIQDLIRPQKGQLSIVAPLSDHFKDFLSRNKLSISL